MVLLLATVILFESVCHLYDMMQYIRRQVVEIMLVRRVALRLFYRVYALRVGISFV